MKVKRESLSDLLQKVLDLTVKSEVITYRKLFSIFAGKGYAALIILLSLPFCLPIQIPGFSTPFGLILAFIGLRIAFGKRLWWPKWLLEKEISGQALQKAVSKSMGFVKDLQKIVKPRLETLTANPILRRLHGILIFLLALLLSLPLPIPLTNMLAAIPILCIGLGLLEDDGVALLVGYGLALVCFGAFIGLFFLGKQILP
ncbi:MAG: exopolysaccharide biosynthesis protein [Parachlamydia sp.]|nr:exopolysaccharide biosynthesis protein [Parachlamydia sp.]